MTEEKKNTPVEEKAPVPKQWNIPFDATTNFSILGWLLDKFKRREDSNKQIDFILED